MSTSAAHAAHASSAPIAACSGASSARTGARSSAATTTAGPARADSAAPPSASTCAVGVVGLGVMGSSLCLNIAEHASCRVAGFDLSSEKAHAARAPRARARLFGGVRPRSPDVPARRAGARRGRTRAARGRLALRGLYEAGAVCRRAHPAAPHHPPRARGQAGRCGARRAVAAPCRRRHGRRHGQRVVPADRGPAGSYGRLGRPLHGVRHMRCTRPPPPPPPPPHSHHPPCARVWRCRPAD